MSSGCSFKTKGFACIILDFYLAQCYCMAPESRHRATASDSSGFVLVGRDEKQRERRWWRRYRASTTEMRKVCYACKENAYDAKRPRWMSFALQRLRPQMESSWSVLRRWVCLKISIARKLAHKFFNAVVVHCGTYQMALSRGLLPLKCQPVSVAGLSRLHYVACVTWLIICFCARVAQC